MTGFFAQSSGSAADAAETAAEQITPERENTPSSVSQADASTNNRQAGNKASGPRFALGKKAMMFGGAVAFLLIGAAVMTMFSGGEPSSPAARPQNIGASVAEEDGFGGGFEETPLESAAAAGAEDVKPEETTAAMMPELAEEQSQASAAQTALAGASDRRTLPAAKAAETLPAAAVAAAEAQEALLDRIQALETRLARVEKQLSAHSAEMKRLRSARSTAQPVRQVKAVRTKSQDRTKVVSRTTQDKQDRSPALKTAKVSQPAASCSYLGGLNNRAWVSCKTAPQVETLYTVVAGDVLPHPYGKVTGVNDRSGVVTTQGGVIQ